MRAREFTREGLKNPKDNPCWKGYKPAGTKKKAGKTVPNCVPVREFTELELAIMEGGHSLDDSLKEISYADAAGELKVSLSDIQGKSKIVGDVEGLDVYLYVQAEQELYYFIEDDAISAFIILLNGNLRGVRNYTTGGKITALISFVTRTLGKKIKIDSAEDLTPQGFAWLKSFIKANGRGLTVTDQTGQLPNIKKLEKEWQTSRVTKEPGPTSIIIESHLKTPLKPKTHYNLLMNTYCFLHCDDIL